MNTKATAQHTPTPWVHDPVLPAHVYSDDATGSIVATCTGFSFAPRPEAEKRANAAFIVRACNAHDELVAALRMVCDSGVALAQPIEKAMCAALAKAGAL